MKPRAEKLGRMVSLMKLQLRLSEWQLTQLRQQEQNLQEEETYLVTALNERRLPMGSSSESIARRLTTTGAGVRAVQAQASRQLDQVRAENRRVKHLEQIARAAAAARLRDAEARALEEMTNLHAGRRDRTATTGWLDSKE
ncbi:hypothetical protein QUH67_27455 [Bradyrhizobium roseum]|nr:hypothetical protein QUH67_27455 [Bradyrhizobium roseus]